MCVVQQHYGQRKTQTRTQRRAFISKRGSSPESTHEINLELDPQGRLIYFQAIPPQKESASSPPVAYDWKPLFAEADLDPANYQKAEPQWNSLASSDSRAAWTGVWPGTSRPIRIEAASLHGKPVYFSLVGDWTKPDRVEEPAQSVGKKIGQILSIVLLLSLGGSAVFLARRNYRHGRADRDGAYRIATIIFVSEILLWLCRSHLVPWAGDPRLLYSCALRFLICRCIYLDGLPGCSSRGSSPLAADLDFVVAAPGGQLRDLLVGRDILFGVILGAVWIGSFRSGASP